MNKYLYTLLFLVFTALSVFGQTESQYYKSAEAAYASNNYYAALTYYLEVEDRRKKEDIDLKYKIAESARKNMSYEISEEYYKYVVENDNDNAYPLSTYYWAEMLQALGKYEDAIKQYKDYLLENNGDDAYFTFKADKERKASEWAMAEDNIETEAITAVNAGNINTKYSDVAPSIYGNELYYSSMRFESGLSDGDRVSKILKTEIPDDFDDSFAAGSLVEGDLNSNAGNTANTAFNKDKTKIFYTICERINEERIRCDLYCRMIDEEGNFGEAKKLPDFVNAEGYTSTQPSVGYDADRDKEILYFSSDREGGSGKLDIWYSIIDNKDNFTKPMNLEAVNTKEDELTPFFHIPSNTLYFSSDGYRSWGGYDVYSSALSSNGYGEPFHLEAPLNSSYHDIYFVMADDGKTGFLATNREGAQYRNSELKTCCFDIYKVEFKPLIINLNALTYDKFSLADLDGATVRLINEDTGELIGEITNNDGNDHKFLLDRCTNYLIIAEKEGYKSDTIRYSTCPLRKSTDIIKKLYLEPDLLELDVFTFDEATMKELVGATVTLTDVTDPQAEPIVIQNATANDFNFSLIRGHKYIVTAFKPGYFPASADVITENVAGTKIVKKLYLKKDITTDPFLPCNLYFDNDHPNPKTTARSTKKTYTETYDRYLTRKETFERKSADPEGIQVFFDSKVTGGYNKFQNFLSELKPLLMNGEKFEITIKGYASPLSQTNYNLYLGQRRISSIENEIKKYGLETYLDSGQLKVTDISYGETLSPKNVSDSSSNTRASIYSVEASMERRVEIIEVIRQQN